MKEIRLHGRGGQGTAMAQEMLVAAFVAEGKYATGFPMYGSERRGAPVTSFVRIDEKPIREKTKIYNPDCLVLMDFKQIKPPLVFEGLKPAGILVSNAPVLPNERPHSNVALIAIADADSIALQELGIQATNTTMLGVFAAGTRWISLASIYTVLGQYFEGDLLKKNMRCVERGFAEIQIARW